jgi:hypothetical protein
LTWLHALPEGTAQRPAYLPFDALGTPRRPQRFVPLDEERGRSGAASFPGDAQLDVDVRHVPFDSSDTQKQAVGDRSVR